MEDHNYHATQEREPPSSEKLKRKELKRQLDKKYQKTRIQIGDACHMWKSIKEDLCLKSDAEVAWMLLNNLTGKKEDTNRFSIYTVKYVKNMKDIPKRQRMQQSVQCKLIRKKGMSQRRSSQPEDPGWPGLVPKHVRRSVDSALYTAAPPPTATVKEEEEQ